MTKNSPKLRVLVVDDEFLIRWSIAETLESAGHEVLQHLHALIRQACGA